MTHSLARSPLDVFGISTCFLKSKLSILLLPLPLFLSVCRSVTHKHVRSFITACYTPDSRDRAVSKTRHRPCPHEQTSICSVHAMMRDSTGVCTCGGGCWYPAQALFPQVHPYPSRWGLDCDGSLLIPSLVHCPWKLGSHSPVGPSVARG